MDDLALMLCSIKERAFRLICNCENEYFEHILKCKDDPFIMRSLSLEGVHQMRDF